MKRILAMIVIGATTLLTAPAFAQPDGARRAQVRQQVTDFLIQRLTQELALDAPTAAQVRQIWEQYQTQIEGTRKEMGMAMRELKAQLAQPSPDNARLSQLADLLHNDRLKVEELDHQRTGDLRRVLTPVQWAKAIVISPKLKRQVQQQIMQAVRAGQPPAGEENE